MRVAIKKTDHATRGPWTPEKYDVAYSAHNDGIPIMTFQGHQLQSVRILLLPGTEMTLHSALHSGASCG